MQKFSVFLTFNCSNPSANKKCVSSVVLGKKIQQLNNSISMVNTWQRIIGPKSGEKFLGKWKRFEVRWRRGKSVNHADLL